MDFIGFGFRADNLSLFIFKIDSLNYLKNWTKTFLGTKNQTGLDLSDPVGSFKDILFNPRIWLPMRTEIFSRIIFKIT